MAICWFLLVALAAAGADAVSHPFVGVTHTQRSGLQVVAIDLDAPGLRFQLTQPSGKRETTRQTTLAFCRELGAQICVNAHFFEPYPSTEMESFVIGLAAAEGRKYSEFENPRQSYALVPNAPALHISATNRAELIGPGYGGRLWTALAGSAQLITGGAVTIPEYKDAAHSEGILQPAKYNNARSWYAVKTSRTVIGLSGDRKRLYLVTAGKIPLRELARTLIREFGVCDALNLDGGGSTTLVMETGGAGGLRVLMPAAGKAPRAVASSLAVFARPQ